MEVKTRAQLVWGDPSLAVDRRKLKALARVAQAYVHQYQIASDYRFDIVAVCDDRIEHFENVSWLFH